jgi:hypothetical protein
MTEREWLQATNPDVMIKFLRGKPSERKLKLFAVACCRQFWHLLTDERSRRAVEVAERYADGKATAEELAAARTAAARTLVRPAIWDAACAATSSTTRAATWIAGWAMARAIAQAIEWEATWAAVRAEAWVEAWETTTWIKPSSLLRDIFANPFRPNTLNPTWLTWHDGLLVSMAQKMYDGHDFSDMPVLADALEDAGCDNLDILTHCRHPSEHVRGCWVVDSILGRS